MDWNWWWRVGSDIAFYWIGWQLLDLLRLAAVGAVVTAGGWLIARSRASSWQRDLRGASIGLVALTVVLALSHRQPEVSPNTGEIVTASRSSAPPLASLAPTKPREVTAQLEPPTTNRSLTGDQVLTLLAPMRALAGPPSAPLPCWVRVSATKENAELNEQLMKIAKGVGCEGFELDNPYQEQVQIETGPTPTPEVGHVVIRVDGQQDTYQIAKGIYDAMKGYLNVKITLGSTSNQGDITNRLYIDIEPGSPWMTPSR